MLTTNSAIFVIIRSWQIHSSFLSHNRIHASDFYRTLSDFYRTNDFYRTFTRFLPDSNFQCCDGPRKVRPSNERTPRPSVGSSAATAHPQINKRLLVSFFSCWACKRSVHSITIFLRTRKAKIIILFVEQTEKIEHHSVCWHVTRGAA